MFSTAISKKHTVTPQPNRTARRGRKLPEVLTPEERYALLKQPSKRAPTSLRNRCLLTVMLDAGLRSTEVLHLNVHDIDWMSGKLTVKQGKKDRVLWLNENAIGVLRRLKEKRIV